MSKQCIVNEVDKISFIGFLLFVSGLLTSSLGNFELDKIADLITATGTVIGILVAYRVAFIWKEQKRHEIETGTFRDVIRKLTAVEKDSDLLIEELQSVHIFSVVKNRNNLNVSLDTDLVVASQKLREPFSEMLRSIAEVGSLQKVLLKNDELNTLLSSLQATIHSLILTLSLRESNVSYLALLNAGNDNVDLIWEINEHIDLDYRTSVNSSALIFVKRLPTVSQRDDLTVYRRIIQYNLARIIPFFETALSETVGVGRK